MKKLNLKYGELMQGNFAIGKLNFLFAFQVNCPGCFFYGIPIVNSLYEVYQNKIQFLGLSTAFEDFNFNTAENTLALVDKGTLVGETQKAFAHYSPSTSPERLLFPVAMDHQWGSQQFQTEDHLKQATGVLPDYLLQHIYSLPVISHTFWLNEFRGTPTMLIFDQEYNILEHWFGHVHLDQIDAAIKKWQKEGLMMS